MFSGAEIAILSLRKTRLAELVDEGSAAARAVDRLRHQPERFLATVQIGITVIGATAAAFGGASIAERLAPVLAAVPGLAGVADNLALVIVVVLVSFLSLVLGELVPKSLALRKSETYALVIGTPLEWVAWLATPLVWLLTAASNLVLRVFGDRTTFTEARLSREELEQIVDEAAISGSVDANVGEIASRALAFEDLDASDCMVPASSIRSVPRSITVADLVPIARDARRARLPVYDGRPDDFCGVINVREVLASGVAGPIPASLVHPVAFVPENMSAPAVLRELQGRRAHLAIVVDETGSVRGLVTVEDLLEELVGEIWSEQSAPTEGILKDEDGSYLVPGGMAVHQVNRELGIELPEGETFSTVAGLAIDLAGRIPEPGQRLPTGEGWCVEVVDANVRRVRTLRIRRTDEDREEA